MARGNNVATGLVAIAFTIAIFFYGGATYFLLLMTSAILFLGVVAQGLSVIGGRQCCWSKAHSCAVVYVVYLIANLFTSVFPENSVQITWLMLAMPMVVFLCGPLADRKWRSLVGLIGLACLFSAVWGLLEFLTQDGRATGPGIDPNSWASVLNLFFFVLLSIYLSARLSTRYSIVVLGAMAIVSMAMFSAYSRIANLNFVAALMFVLVLSCFSAQLRRQAGVVLLVAVMSYITVASIRSSEDATSHDEGYTLNVESIGWSQRFSQWQAGLAQYRDHPVVGSGLGTFKVLYPQYRTLGDIRTAGNYVHNDYIQFLVEGGPLLLLLVLLVPGFLAYQLWLNISYFVRLREARLIEPVVLIVAMGTVYVHSLMNFTLYNLPNQILLGCCLARLLFLTGMLRTVFVELRSPKLAQIATVAFTAYVVVINCLDFVSFDLVYDGGLIPVDNELPYSQLWRYDTISSINRLRKNVSGNRFAMATFYRGSFDQLDPGNLDARNSLAIVTAMEYQRGLEINPYHFQVRGYFSDFLIQNPSVMEFEEVYQTPERLLLEGIFVGPCYVRSYVALATFLEETGRADEAYELLLEQALQWSGLRYDDYQHYQHQLFKKILRGAVIRGDRKTLAKLLIAIGNEV